MDRDNWWIGESILGFQRESTGYNQKREDEKRDEERRKEDGKKETKRKERECYKPSFRVRALGTASESNSSSKAPTYASSETQQGRKSYRG